MIERLRADDLEPWVEDLAHHASEGLLAGTAPKALAYALRAAAAADAAQSSADVALQLQRAIGARRPSSPDVPGTERRELLVRLGIALRDTGDPEGRDRCSSRRRASPRPQGDPHALAAILGSLDAESLWAGYDWSLHDPRVVAAVERALARPGLSDRDRTLLTMALAGELTYVDNARSNRALRRGRAPWPRTSTTLCCRRGSSSAGSGRCRARRVSRREPRSATSSSPSTATACSRPRLRPLAHLARVSSALEVGDAELARRCVDRARALAHPVRTPTGWAHLQFAEAGLALLDGDLERARAHADALRPALQRVRRYTADSSPASILAVVETEAGDTDAALAWLAVLLGVALRRADPLARGLGPRRGRPTRRGAGGAGRLRRTAARRLAAAPAHHRGRPRRRGGGRPPVPPPPPAGARAGRRPVRVPGRGRARASGPVGLAVGAGARRARSTPRRPDRTPSGRWPSPSRWARCCGCPGPAGSSTSLP